MWTRALSLTVPLCQRCRSPLISQYHRLYSSLSQPDSPLQHDALAIFNTAIDSVLPNSMIKNALNIEGNKLVVGDHEYLLNKNVQVIAFGKAVIGMVRAVEDILGDHIQGGIASIPVGMQTTFQHAGKLDLLPEASSRVKIMEGAKNNIPDENSNRAAMEIYNLARSLTKKQLALTLISGGGSSLLPAPIPPISLDDMAQLTKLLSRSGASIEQLNLVRKNVELLKGGGLAEAISPALVQSLILSDVIGDPLDFIASGPTVRDVSNPQQCLDLFHTLGVEADVPESVLKFLEDQSTYRNKMDQCGPAMPIERSMFSQHQHFDCANARNLVVGSNRIAIESAFDQAKALGYLPYVLSISLGGEARDAGVLLSKLAQFICHSVGNKVRKDKGASLAKQELELIRRGISKDTMKSIVRVAESASNSDRPVCILAAGETVVNVTGKGKGGRNQELALSSALHMNDTLGSDDIFKSYDVQLLSGGTDGQDGPTDAAGALANPYMIDRAQESDLDGLVYLLDNDAYNFYSQLQGGKYLVQTGLTGTNVMDLQVLLIDRKDRKP